MVATCIRANAVLASCGVVKSPLGKGWTGSVSDALLAATSSITPQHIDSTVTMPAATTLSTEETWDGVPLSELFPEDKLGWRG